MAGFCAAGGGRLRGKVGVVAVAVERRHGLSMDVRAAHAALAMLENCSSAALEIVGPAELESAAVGMGCR